MEGFDDRTSAAIRFAGEMTVDSSTVSEETFAAVKSHFDDGEVVELCAVIGIFNYFNCFNNALHMEISK